mmetsp:Transcript_12581/g.25515  ORF Transcript_12581/g.25515 Transcript_12581/m.25515 type:complete len:155 (-) Transcript_12581:277-741(-)
MIPSQVGRYIVSTIHTSSQSPMIEALFSISFISSYYKIFLLTSQRDTVDSLFFAPFCSSSLKEIAPASRVAHQIIKSCLPSTTIEPNKKSRLTQFVQQTTSQHEDVSSHSGCSRLLSPLNYFFVGVFSKQTVTRSTRPCRETLHNLSAQRLARR